MTSVASLLQLVGMGLFLAGIAVGMLLVFTDMHGYERPIQLRIVLTILSIGLAVFLVGWILHG